MDNGILASIKKLLGIASDDTTFDGDITVHINSAFSILTQLGVGPACGFTVGATTTWDSFIPNRPCLNLVRTYVYLKVRMVFDPPTSSSVIEAITKQITEFECRILYETDNPSPEVEPDPDPEPNANDEGENQNGE